MMKQIPPCPKCHSNERVSRIAYAIYPRHVVDFYVCCACEEPFEVESMDPNDERLMTRPVTKFVDAPEGLTARRPKRQAARLLTSLS